MRRVRHGSKLFTFISLLIPATVFEERIATSQSAPGKCRACFKGHVVTSWRSHHLNTSKELTVFLTLRQFSSPDEETLNCLFLPCAYWCTVLF